MPWFLGVGRWLKQHAIHMGLVWVYLPRSFAMIARVFLKFLEAVGKTCSEINYQH